MPAQNGPAVVNGGASLYNRAIAYNSPVAYDSGLFLDPNEQTLFKLRKRLLIRLGFSAQSANPPPGMADLLNDFLQSSNQFLYRQFPQQMRERFWTIQTIADRAVYDIPVDLLDYLDTRKVIWVGCQDDQQWYQLRNGIDPTLYTTNQTQRPQRYEFRKYLEIWPVPNEVFLIHIKGEAGVSPFAVDTDVPSVDSELVFLFALARAKSHYGQPDAKIYEADTVATMRKLNAGTHQTARYIPGTVVGIDGHRPRLADVILDASGVAISGLGIGGFQAP